MNQIIKLKRGAAKDIPFTLYDSANAKINLTGATVYFTIKRGAETPVLMLGACTVAANQTTNKGEVSYSISAETTSLLVADEYDGEICVVDTDNNVEFYPNDDSKARDYLKIIVSDALAQPE